ncbi:hypothetical protein F5050DRAFT_1772560 [Lentinula boryana]|uniref:SUN domain-containing protein n=1 Tax=Lentinula boryana TaxID=40481 RepID=A0ABQ8Q805_9AGAR|nr:hypothetical protein F5050DRAFT_1772560 [Lentinula boryana]
MSFAGTPLGQGRRLDHQSFLGKPPSKGSTTTSGGNTTQSTQSQRITPVPTSYSYGAPILGSRSPPKTSSNPTDLQPEKWSVRDTSVNAASAIYQAMSNQNEAWASSSRRITTTNPPRSTSVEYESQATTNARRLGLPPSRLGSKTKPPVSSTKPVSMTGNSSSRSIIIPDSEGEQSQSQIREKSPFSFDHLTNLAQTAIQRTSYFVKERQKNGNGAGDASYDYETEDREFEEYQRRNNNNGNSNPNASTLSKNLSTSAVHRKNRISMDNKAYKPTQAELEDSSSEDEDDVRKRRRRKGAGGPAGGPLTTLPKVGPEKRRKRGSRKTKLGEGEEEEEEDQEDQEQIVSASQRGSVPPVPAPIRRSRSQSRQPPNDTSLSHSFINHSSLNLDAIPEDPDPESHAGEYDDSYSRSYLGDDTHSLISLRPSSTGIGAKLGVIVYTFFRLIGVGLSGAAHFVGRVLGWLVGLLVLYPIRGVSRISSSTVGRGRGVGYYFLVAVLILVGAWVVNEWPFTSDGGLSSSSSSWRSFFPHFGSGSSQIKYAPPALPVENADELNARLRTIESALSALVLENEVTKGRLRVAEDEVKERTKDLEREKITERQRERSRIQQQASESTRQEKEKQGREKEREKEQERAEMIIGELKKRIGVLEGMIKGDIGKRVERVEGELGGIGREVREREQREMRNKKEREALEMEMERLKSVVGVLQARPIATSSSSSGDASSDMESRAQLALLEERLGVVEGGVKEAIDIGKNALKDIKSNTNTNTDTNWWSKLSSTSKTPADEQELSSLLTSLVSSALSTHSKDIIARADYALHSGGARVIPSLTSDTFTLRPSHSTWTSQFLSVINLNPFSTAGSNGVAVGRPPVWALHPDITNGLCWPFNGAQGQLGIALAAPIVVDSVTVDHVSAETAYEDGLMLEEEEQEGKEDGKENNDKEKRKRKSKRRSAPREIEVWGLVEGKENVRRVSEWREGVKVERERRQKENNVDKPDSNLQDDSDILGLSELDVSYPSTLPQTPEYIRLASFAYDVHSPEHIQTFPVLPYVRKLGVDFGVVVVMVRNNWGMEEYTCLYRVRVHGARLLE